jgi:hypothetical protein
MENIVGGIIGSWMFIVTIIFVVYIRQNNDIIRIGPNPDFYILGICINSVSKYGIVVSFCFINSSMRAMNGNVLHSWVINEIQDVKNKNIINKNKAYTLSCISVLYNWFDFFMYMNILLSQIDMLLIEIFADILVTFYLTKYYLRCKTTTEENHQYSIVYVDIENNMNNIL